MKNKKLFLDGLSVESFVTSFKEQEQMRQRGGQSWPECKNTHPAICTPSEANSVCCPKTTICG